MRIAQRIIAGVGIPQNLIQSRTAESRLFQSSCQSLLHHKKHDKHQFAKDLRFHGKKNPSLAGRGKIHSSLATNESGKSSAYANYHVFSDVQICGKKPVRQQNDSLF